MNTFPSKNNKEKKSLADLVSDVMKKPSIDVEKAYEEMVAKNERETDREPEKQTPTGRLGIV